MADVRNWYALRDTGDIVLIGAFDDFHGASDCADDTLGNCVWLFDQSDAERMANQLANLFGESNHG